MRIDVGYGKPSEPSVLPEFCHPFHGIFQLQRYGCTRRSRVDNLNRFACADSVSAAIRACAALAGLLNLVGVARDFSAGQDAVFVVIFATNGNSSGFLGDERGAFYQESAK